jgi:hypothetical protein
LKVLLNGNEIAISSLSDNSICSNDIDYTSNKNKFKQISCVVHKIGNYAKKTYVSSRFTQMFAGVIGVNDDGFYNILTKLQDFSFYIAVGWATWGIIGYILDKPSGVEKIKRAVWGYIGINAVPTLFAMIRDSFRMTNYNPTTAPSPSVPNPSQQSMLDIDHIKEFFG